MNSCNTDIFCSNYYHLQSVRFEYLFHIFLNDLNPIGLNNVSLIKYADVSSFLIAVNEQRDNSEMLYRSS